MLSIQEFNRITFYLKIMNYIYLNPESKESSENNLINKFGKQNWKLFQQFAIGGSNALVHEIKGPKDEIGFKLTQEGVREFHRLSQQRNNMIIQILMVLVAFFSGITTLISVLKQMSLI
jgi:hypothetical protein